jgi:phenylacetate-CoA ligase
VSDWYARLLRGVVLPIGDALRAMPIGAVLRTLDETQWRQPAELRALQAEKLARLVETAYAHVPYVRETMQARGLAPRDVRSADDLHKLPLMDRRVLRENWPARITHQGPRAPHSLVMRTGGSTGEPLFFRISRASRTWDRASYYRCLAWCGVGRAETVMNVWGRLIVAGRTPRLLRAAKERFVTREHILDAFTMSPESMRAFVRRMRRLRARLLRGYTSALVDLGRFVESERLELPPLAALSTTAEQVLPEQRRFLERVFCAPLFDQYGCAEVGGAAYECDRHAGLHVASEHCVIEIVDDAGTPLPPGRVGRIALTNLDNEVTPFLRYANDDMAAAIAEPCPCGRGLPLLSPVTGRVSDMIHGANGQRVHGEFFTHLLHELGLTESLPVREFQVEQTAADRLVFRIVSDRPASDAEIARLRGEIREYLGEMRVDFEAPPALPRTGSGKRRFTLRSWNPEPSDVSR